MITGVHLNFIPLPPLEVSLISKRGEVKFKGTLSAAGFFRYTFEFTLRLFSPGFQQRGENSKGTPSDSFFATVRSQIVANNCLTDKAA